MKNEKFLQAISKLDEKFISEADRDVNAWLGSMEGEVVTVSARRTSPWRIAAAASVTAAAVFGAVMLAKNVTTLPKPNVAASSGATLDEQLENLNFDKAVVFDNIPNSGQWQRLEYEKTKSVEFSADRLVRIAADYGVTIDKNDIMAVGKDVGFGFKDIPLSEADPDFTKYTAIYYNSDELYIHAIPSPANWFELVNKKNAQTIAGAEINGFGTWRTSDGRVNEQFVDATDETKTCVLDGKTVKIAYALRNAEKIIAQCDLFPKEFDTKIIKDVRVYTYANGNQGLWVELTYSFDGVPYLSNTALNLDISHKSNQAYSSSVYFGMLTENSIDWIWQYEGFAEAEFTRTDCTVNISRDDALKIVSEKLEQSHKNSNFIVREVQLAYSERFTDSGNTLCIEPTWIVYLTRNDDCTERQYAFVSAVDGNVYILEIQV